MQEQRKFSPADQKRHRHNNKHSSPYHNKPDRQVLMLNQQIVRCRREQQIPAPSKIAQSQSDQLNGGHSPQQRPNPARQEVREDQDTDRGIAQWKQNRQGHRNVNCSTVIQLIHNSISVRPSAIWRQLFTALLLITGMWAHASEEDGRIKALMHSFVLEFSKMSPYLVNEQVFTSAKGRETINESLKNLSSKIKSPPPGLKQSPGFRITYGLLADHLQKTQQAFDSGEMEYARMRVNGIGNLCAACHMQAPKISHFSAFEFVTERNKTVTFENAEFLFVIRRYDEVLPMLDKLVREYPKSSITSDQLNEAYRRKLAIFARVFKDPNAAIENLNQDLKNKEIPVDVRRNIESWLTTLNDWKKEKVDPSKLKTPELIQYVSKNLPKDLGRKIAPGSPQLLQVLRLSGLLYERLYRDDEGDQTQALLYYLAQCERSLAPLYWYSVNEIYLKECIVQYPKKSYSKKCYDAYREGMQERYFGRPMPEGVTLSLEALRRYL